MIRIRVIFLALSLNLRLIRLTFGVELEWVVVVQSLALLLHSALILFRLWLVEGQKQW